MSHANDKENPNPKIHGTAKRTHLSETADVKFLGSNAIRRYRLGSKIPLRYDQNDYVDIEYSLPIVPTAEERLVSTALSEAAYINNRKGATMSPSVDNVSLHVELLHNATFPMFRPNELQKALQVPSFTPYGMPKITNTTSRKRDAITANEIFEIIRNVQDPEHPLTLEQLNVVRLELVKVVDVHPDIDEEVRAPDSGSSKPRFSTVSVQFT